MEYLIARVPDRPPCRNQFHSSKEDKIKQFFFGKYDDSEIDKSEFPNVFGSIFENSSLSDRPKAEASLSATLGVVLDKWGNFGAAS